MAARCDKAGWRILGDQAVVFFCQKPVLAGYSGNQSQVGVIILITPMVMAKLNVDLRFDRHSFFPAHPYMQPNIRCVLVLTQIFGYAHFK
jgi:hypothetical protein